MGGPFHNRATPSSYVDFIAVLFKEYPFYSQNLSVKVHQMISVVGMFYDSFPIWQTPGSLRSHLSLIEPLQKQQAWGFSVILDL